MLAYQQAVNESREKLLIEVVEKLPNEFGLLAQALINAMR
jgi:hypothetical protein